MEVNVKAETKKGRGGKIQLIDLLKFVSLLLLIIMFTLINNKFVSTYNLSNILADICPLLLISCGATFVLLMGSIDLSIGSICSCAAVIFVLVLQQNAVLAYFAAIAFGALAGFINGVVFAKVKVPSFIVTLGAMSVWQSAAYLLSGGKAIQITKVNWTDIGWVSIKFGVLSVPLFISLVFLFIMYIVQSRTKTGVQAFAVGANEGAARIAGVNINFIKIMMFVICGICCGLTGIFVSAKLKAGIPTVGDNYTLLGVAAAVLGGTSLSGGKGGVLYTLLGSLLVIVIQNGMDISAVTPHWKMIVFGILVILAVFITTDRKQRNLIMK